jgi:hypothetical protein
LSSTSALSPQTLKNPIENRNQLTLKQKYDLVQEAEKKAKPTQKELGIKFGIGKTTVSDRYIASIFLTLHKRLCFHHKL